MKEINRITSTGNPRIKYLLKLISKASVRRKDGLFSLEGKREVKRAVQQGYETMSVFCCPDIIPPDELASIVPVSGENMITWVSKHVYSRIAYRGESGGVVAVLKQKDHRLDQLTLGKNPLLLVLETVEKPGNLGAIMRTADAAGIDAVIVCDPSTDIYNPNVIRSSTGALFSVPVAVAGSEEVISYLRSKGVSIFSASLEGSIPYTQADFRQSSAIVLGTEAHGLTEIWTASSDQNIIIPMRGSIDSLNVSITAAVMTFEAIRQRDSSKPG